MNLACVVQEHSSCLHHLVSIKAWFPPLVEHGNPLSAIWSLFWPFIFDPALYSVYSYIFGRNDALASQVATTTMHILFHLRVKSNNPHITNISEELHLRTPIFQHQPIDHIHQEPPLWALSCPFRNPWKESGEKQGTEEENAISITLQAILASYPLTIFSKLHWPASVSIPKPSTRLLP